MKLTTPVPFPAINPQLEFKDGIVFIGSCFSEHIGGWLAGLKFQASANLTGISYNPVSIAKHIQMALKGKGVDGSLTELSSGQVVHTDFHSSFNHAEKGVYIDQVNGALTNLKTDLTNAKALFLTFGTAIVFARKDSGEIANNCHKLPSSHFEQRFIDEAEMKDAVLMAIDAIKRVNPGVRIFLTVSPVRHLRHGAVENQRSKSRLLRLCEMLCNTSPEWTYLPIYEYVMDELRDYRYYRHDDMIHLSQLGLEMVREKVREHLLSPEARELLNRIEMWQSMKNHRVMQENTESARAFRKKLEEETAALEALLPGRFSESD